jgi:hypothetical protein
MRDFSKVSPLLWRDKRFNSLASSDARLAMLYFFTCEHQNSAGCYRLPDGYASADLSWALDHYVTVRQQVVDAGLILFDDDTKELFIVGWFKTNPAMGSKHAIGCERLIGNIESDAIREAAEEEFLQSEEHRQSQSQKPSGSVQSLQASNRLASTNYLTRGQ